MSRSRSRYKEKATNEIVRIFAKNANQQKLIDSIRSKPITIASASAGCGKTLIALAESVWMLHEGDIDKILYVKPIVDFAEQKSLGFLPGPQPLDAKVLTPKGWATMGSLKKGDLVITQTGESTKVVGIYPKGLKDVYEISTSDGAKVQCCLDHLWLTQTAEEKKRGKKGQVRPTSEIMSTLNDNKVKPHLTNHILPRVLPVQFEKNTSLVISPYTLGALLGDGCLGNSISLCVADKEIADRVDAELKPLGYCLTFPKEEKGIIHNVRSSTPLLSNKISKSVTKICNNTGEKEYFHSINVAAKHLGLSKSQVIKLCKGKIDLGLDFCLQLEKTEDVFSNKIKQELQNLKLLKLKAWEKFIPENYLYSSIEDRVSLLQGLMDTDGTIKKKTGESSFTTTSEKLAQDLKQLVLSLGGSANIRVRNRIGKTSELKTFNNKELARTITSKRISYDLSISLPTTINPFYLNRKAQFFKPKYSKSNYITKIEAKGQKEVQCIRVAHESHLYVTDGYTVTHNTLEEKVQPLLYPVLDNLSVFLSPGKAKSLVDQKKIEFMPLEFIRGRSLRNTVIILDEAQNCSKHCALSVISRLEKTSKAIILGDPQQRDLILPQNALTDAMIRLQGLSEVGLVKFSADDIVRSAFLKKVINRYEA